MKRLITIAITLLVILGISFGVAHYTHTKFIDFSFLIGLAVTVIIWFFTSKGGFTSRHTDLQVQGTTGIKVEQQKFEFSPNLAFITSLAYTIITFAAMLYHYRSYL
ncbi:hypothetical protein QNH20_14780 [Neobacillus sp. WH10]|uniref:hypothetical protein n=1 Tax=Neobacillus sp. WH10 TaxID=3047873 RepID=UPI0024C14BCE|nr:hypothetical protein [Neobacillus sp. WH10]WHY75410.1 hypothetical protein QNH20_14780 [Neobacillus sp. WH10]